MDDILRSVIVLMFEDQGLNAPETVPLPEQFVLEGKEVKIDWGRVATFLKTLSKEDFVSFCVGDRDDMVRLAEGEEGSYAMNALDDLFLSII